MFRTNQDKSNLFLIKSRQELINERNAEIKQMISDKRNRRIVTYVLKILVVGIAFAAFVIAVLEIFIF